MTRIWERCKAAPHTKPPLCFHAKWKCLGEFSQQLHQRERTTYQNFLRVFPTPVYRCGEFAWDNEWHGSAAAERHASTSGPSALRVCVLVSLRVCEWYWLFVMIYFKSFLVSGTFAFLFLWLFWGHYLQLPATRDSDARKEQNMNQ